MERNSSGCIPLRAGRPGIPSVLGMATSYEPAISTAPWPVPEGSRAKRPGVASRKVPGKGEVVTPVSAFTVTWRADSTYGLAAGGADEGGCASRGHWKVISPSDTNKWGTGESFTLTSTPPRLAGSGDVSATIGSMVVNASPNNLAQLPGLQKSVDWRLAAFRIVTMFALSFRTRISVCSSEEAPALFVAVAVIVKEPT